MDKAIQDIVDCITNSSEYKDCLKIKEKMSQNKELLEKIEKVKKLQKKYLKTMDINVENELKKVKEELNEIPIYVLYNQKLNIINEKINYVNDEINDYFYKLFNEE